MKRFQLVLLFTLVVFFLSPLFLIAQKAPIKFGKVDVELLIMTEYPNDTNAAAVILCDYGRTYFELSGGRFLMHFNRIFRIKVLDKRGYKWANWSIPLLNFGTIKEEISLLRGVVVNQKDNKIIKDKLNSKGKFLEKVHSHLDKMNFTMPNIVVGSVIDIEYTIVSPFYYNLQDWYFQYDIPVAWSEYIVEIPEYFNYVKNMKGYVPLYNNEKGAKYGSYGIRGQRGVHVDPTTGMTTAAQKSTVEYLKNTERFVAKEVPSFIVEKPLSSKENYISKIEYELASYQLPYRGPKKISATWESINDKLIGSDDFGGRLYAGGFLNKVVDTINTRYENSYDKMVAAYEYIQSYMKWNDVSRIYAYKPLRSAYKEKVGTDADINLMLVVLLNELGIHAEPVIISTKSHGILQIAHPTLSGFNSVIVKAIIAEDDYLMDASVQLIPCGTLPLKALNGKGRLISGKGSEWVDLAPSEVYEKLTMYTMQMDENGVFNGEIQVSCKGYAALSTRNAIDKSDSEEEYIEDMQDMKDGLSIRSFEFSDREDFYKDLKEKYKVEIKDNAIEAGNLLYFRPLFYEALEENPFKLEERLYPVEYAYKKDFTYMLNFTVPEGYKLEEKPENEFVSLPDNAANFSYQISVNGNRIQVMSKYSINKITYPSEDYSDLKEFFNHIVAKHAEQIVLIKE